MGKHVRFGAVPSAVAVAAHQAGKIKIIALTGSQKNPATPEVPLMNSVYTTFVFSLDVGLVFKKGVDPERISWIEKEFKKALLDREVQQKLEKNSAFVNTSLQTPKQYKDHVKQMEKKLSPIVDRITK
jgi:tripartite-type tricarboxylate transporter receptor subunit TctC